MSVRKVESQERSPGGQQVFRISLKIAFDEIRNGRLGDSAEVEKTPSADVFDLPEEFLEPVGESAGAFCGGARRRAIRSMQRSGRNAEIARVGGARRRGRCVGN